MISNGDCKIHSYKVGYRGLDLAIRPIGVPCSSSSLGGWEVLRSFNIYAFDAHRVLKRLHAEYFVHAFFKVYVESDSYSGQKNIIHIMPDGLGMPHRYVIFYILYLAAWTMDIFLKNLQRLLLESTAR